jgi:hypothetical protein
MQFMLLIYGDEEAWSSQTEEEGRATMEAYFAYTQALRDADVFVAGDPLEPTQAAKTVRVRGGDTLTTDGPFAETKEQLGGYYLIDVPSEAEALEWAAKLPGAQHGSVEVRPLMPVPAVAE